MTASGRRARREQLARLTADAIDASTYGDPAPAEHAGDLRERLADAMKAAPTLDLYDPDTDLVARVTEVCAAVVQPMLDAKDAETERAEATERERDDARAHAAYLDEEIIQPERRLHEETIKRAERAEAVEWLRQAIADGDADPVDLIQEQP